MLMLALTCLTVARALALAGREVAAGILAFANLFYSVIYTVWLKRRSWTNIVVGGLAGSFAVLAGSAAVNPYLPIEPLLLAVVLALGMTATMDAQAKRLGSGRSTGMQRQNVTARCA